ncbi:MAG: hypothetical protein DRI95_11430 [Bacteroidetes bacterium]|nr:MAG: hypothetical protein DRI95_11430 [Bacteroidota bacterium]
MKIFFAAPIYDYRTTLFISQYFMSLARSSVNLGHEVKIFQTTENMYNPVVWNVVKFEFQLLRSLFKPLVDFPHDMLLMKQIINEVEAFRPDVLFLHLIDSSWTHTMLSKIRAKGVKVVFHLGIHPSQISTGIKKLIQHSDLVLIYDKSYLDFYREQLGVNHCYVMPFSCEMEYYNRLYQKHEYCYDISFVGLFDTYRESFLKALTDFDLNIWSWNMDKYSTSLKKFHHGEASGTKMIEIYNKSKIVINIHREFEKSGGNYRMFEIPASKAFQLVDSKREISKYFTPGKEIDVFNSPEELKAKVIYYLSHDNEREKVAKSGYQKVLTQHSMSRRLHDLFREIIKK